MIKPGKFNSFFNLRLLHFTWCIILFCNGLAQKNDSIDEAITYSYDTLAQKKYINSIPWRNSPFISFNFNYPIYNKVEIGQNISSFLAFGISLSNYDNWSNTSSAPKFGFFVIVKTPFYKLPFTPYLCFNKGQTFILFSEPDKYTQFNLGSMTKLFPFLYFKPEIGYCQTKRHISGGTSMFGGSTPIISETKGFISFNVGLEINLLGCLKKHRKIKN